MTAAHILAKTLKDAHAFAREELGLERGQYRIVTSPSSISSVRGADLYLVPGFDKRHDRFAMQGALRYTRLNKIDVAELRERGVADDLEPAGVQLTLISDEEASAFLTVEVENQALEELDHNEQAEDAVKRRRRRCKECGILVDPDEVETHNAEHLPVED